MNMLFYFEFSCIQILLNLHMNELLFCKLISNTIHTHTHTHIQTPTLVTLRSHSKVSDNFQLLIFVVATRFYHRLIVDLALVDTCVVKRYKTSQTSQKVTHKSSKSLQNVDRVPFYMWTS